MWAVWATPLIKTHLAPKSHPALSVGGAVFHLTQEGKTDARYTVSIRVIDIQGEPWFVGKDIAEALGYSNYRDAIQRHCKGVAKHDTLSTEGGLQKMRLINEPDLFRLIVHSQLPAAEHFEKWVFEEVLPTIRKTGNYQTKTTKPLSPIKQAKEAVSYFAHYARAMQRVGFDKNAALISANQATRKVADTDILALGGNTHLAAENQTSLHYSPTELGQQLGGLSAIKVNRLLEAAGLQNNVAGQWQPTPAGRPHAFISDVGKTHGSGVPIQQVRWFESVLPLIQTPPFQQAA